MAGKTLVVDHLKFSYEGLFNLSELYTVISSFFFERGWDWYEKNNTEQITPEGKQIRLVLEPWKSASDFYKIAVKIVIHFTDIKDVEVEHDGQTLKLNQGLVRMTFDGFVLHDRPGNWSLDNPVNFFINVLAQKYFYRQHFLKFETWVKNDIDELHNQIKNYLNVFKYSYHA